MNRRKLVNWCLSFAAGLLALSCGGRQSAVDPAGIQADRLAGLWWLFLWVTAAVYVIVMIVLIIAIFRRPKVKEDAVPETAPSEQQENRAGYVVKGLVGVTVVILFALMITSFRTGAAVNSLSAKPSDLAIKVTGHQWWWEITYVDNESPTNNVTTANEIHVPVGRTVKLMLESNDVIHSLWMPNLHGKKDLIPIYPTTFYFQADKPGTYWGQCAEFCGYQHAKMRIMITAESPEDFEKWMNAGRQTPPTPTAALEKHGRDIFTSSVCAQCHTIQGTGTGGRVGPDLTHVGSRPYLAAGSLQNTPENLASWIRDPQSIKPGIKMPMNLYSDEDMKALVTYLSNLK